MPIALCITVTRPHRMRPAVLRRLPTCLPAKDAASRMQSCCTTRSPSGNFCGINIQPVPCARGLYFKRRRFNSTTCVMVPRPGKAIVSFLTKYPHDALAEQARAGLQDRPSAEPSISRPAAIKEADAHLLGRLRLRPALHGRKTAKVNPPDLRL